MARALRRTAVALSLPALVGASTLAHWLAGRRVTGLWIMPDEAIYAERALQLWRDGSLSVFHGQGAGYGVLYPLLAGFPLAFGNLDTGYASLKLFQALVMSLAAVPVFFYGRRIMPPVYALVAAALTVASPLLLYSGLVMTEVVFYPLSVVTLLAIARAVETATLRHQLFALAWIAAAVATRAQAIVFLAIVAAAALVDTLLAHDRSRLRAFWPTWASICCGIVATLLAPGLFGSYAGTLGRGYPIAASLHLIYEHLAYLVLTTAVLPFAALAVLLVEAIRGRERDAAARALIVVTACAVPAVCAQVGLFAARFSPHLLGRDLASLPPVLFLVFALWLARGLPRRRTVAVPVCFVTLAIVILAPWDRLIIADALPDSFGASLIYGLSTSINPTTLVTFGCLALVVLFLVTPRRVALLLPAVVFALLAASSVSASRRVVSQAARDQQQLLGTPRDWIDRAVHDDVTYLYDGERTWNSVWQQRFWNDRITHVLSLAPARVPGPMDQVVHPIAPTGRLPISDWYVVAPDRFGFAGTPIAGHSRGPDLPSLTLWRVDRPVMLSMVATGFQPNGDILGRGTIDAYSCAGGTFGLTVLPKSTDVVTILLDGKVALRQRIAGLPSANLSVQVPASHRGVCHFTIDGGPLLGTTIRSFDRP
jgi:hypothetical protein